MLELRRIRIPLAYDIGWNKPEPLVERSAALGVRERLDARGDVLAALDLGRVDAAIDELRAAASKPSRCASCTPIAIRAHERAVPAHTRGALPHIHVSLSCDVLPEMLEFERTSTTVVNAYIAPLIATYLSVLRERLRQHDVDAEAAVTFIICGQLADSSVIPDRLAPVVEAGIMPAKLIPDWEIPARDLYKDYPQRQRDEAVRTGAFGAAAMIYAARSLGLGSTPMIGFDAEAVHRDFGLAEDEVPVMLLSVGAERPGNWPQKPRRPVADVLDLI